MRLKRAACGYSIDYSSLHFSHLPKLHNYLLLEALVFAIVCPLLFYIEYKCMGNEAVKQVPAITLLASGYFAYSLLSLSIFRKVLQTRDNRSLLLYYFGSKGIRFFLSVVALTAYAMLVHSQLTLFALNMLVLYFVGVIVGTMYCTKMEKHSK